MLGSRSAAFRPAPRPPPLDPAPPPSLKVAGKWEGVGIWPVAMPPPPPPLVGAVRSGWGTAAQALARPFIACLAPIPRRHRLHTALPFPSAQPPPSACAPTRPQVPADGEWTFFVASGPHASAALLVDGAEVVTGAEGLEAVGAITLGRGRHHLELQYHQRCGDAVLSVQWSGPQMPKGPLTRDRLFPATARGVRCHVHPGAASLPHPGLMGNPLETLTLRAVAPRPAPSRKRALLRYDWAVVVPAPGAWDFRMRVAAPARLLLDGAVVITHDEMAVLSAGAELGGSAALTQGWHRLHLDCLLKGDEPPPEVEWRRVGDAAALWAPLPPAFLPTAHGLAYEWFPGAYRAVPDFAALQCAHAGAVPALGAPLPVPAPCAQYAVRYRARLDVPVAGTWRFALAVADAGRLFIDRVLVAERTTAAEGPDGRGHIALTAGPHELEVHQCVLHDDSAISIEWAAPGGALEGLPRAVLATPEGRRVCVHTATQAADEWWEVVPGAGNTSGAGHVVGAGDVLRLQQVSTGRWLAAEGAGEGGDSLPVFCAEKDGAAVDWTVDAAWTATARVALAHVGTGAELGTAPAAQPQTGDAVVLPLPGAGGAARGRRWAVEFGMRAPVPTPTHLTTLQIRGPEAQPARQPHSAGSGPGSPRAGDADRSQNPGPDRLVLSHSPSPTATPSATSTPDPHVLPSYTPEPAPPAPGEAPPPAPLRCVLYGDIMPTLVRVNQGPPTLIARHQPATVYPDANGLLVIEAELQSLAVPSLQLHIPALMQPGERVVVCGAPALHQRLSAVGAASSSPALGPFLDALLAAPEASAGPLQALGFQGPGYPAPRPHCGNGHRVLRLDPRSRAVCWLEGGPTAPAPASLGTVPRPPGAARATALPCRVVHGAGGAWEPAVPLLWPACQAPGGPWDGLWRPSKPRDTATPRPTPREGVSPSRTPRSARHRTSSLPKPTGPPVGPLAVAVAGTADTAHAELVAVELGSGVRDPKVRFVVVPPDHRLQGYLDRVVAVQVCPLPCLPPPPCTLFNVQSAPSSILSNPFPLSTLFDLLIVRVSKPSSYIHRPLAG